MHKTTELFENNTKGLWQFVSNPTKDGSLGMLMELIQNPSEINLKFTDMEMTIG